MLMTQLFGEKMKKILLMMALWAGAFIVHAEIEQPDPSMPGQQINPGIIGDGSNPGLTPLPDPNKHNSPGLNDHDNNPDDNNNDLFNDDANDNDPNSMNDDPGSDGDLDSGDATTPTAQGA